MQQHLPKECINNLYKIQDTIPPELGLELLIDAYAKKIHPKKGDILCHFYDSSEEVPNPSDLDKTRKNLMVFDDLLLEKQNTCESYYVRGRHRNVESFYLSQNYFKLPRQTIRENANFMCLFPQDHKNIHHIYHDHVSMDMTLDQFRYLCKQSWAHPHGFVVIDLTSEKNNGKYRKNLDAFYLSDLSNV